jgi:transcriptional regulator with XRE-family HTH domain
MQSVSSNALPIVKPLTGRPHSHTLPSVGNTLAIMAARKNVLTILSANLRALMAESRDLTSSTRVATKAAIAQRTVNNLEHGRHDPHLSTIDAIAHAFNLEPYQLLCPAEERELFQVLRAWHVGTAQDRELLLAAAETVNRRHGSMAPLKAGTPHT